VSQPPQSNGPVPHAAQLPPGGPPAVGFPHYRSPEPSPERRTGLLVGTLVVLVTVVFAVVGFLIVGGRGANSPEGAVEGLFTSLADGDSGRAHDLLCDDVAARIGEDDLMTPSGPLAGMQQVTVEVGDATDLHVPGQEAAAVPYRVTDGLGNEEVGTATVVEEKGWRVCGFDR
jgi:hypothetical protein